MVHSFPLRERADGVWYGIILTLARARTEIDLLPLAGLQQPLICRSRDVAAIEEVRPNRIDGSYTHRQYTRS